MTPKSDGLQRRVPSCYPRVRPATWSYRVFLFYQCIAIAEVLVPAEPIEHGDLAMAIEHSEEEDPSKRELVGDHDTNNSTDRISDPASTLTPVGTLSPVESGADNTVDRSADDA